MRHMDNNNIEEGHSPSARVVPPTIIAVDVSVALALPAAPTSASSADVHQATSGAHISLPSSVLKHPRLCVLALQAATAELGAPATNSSAGFLEALSDQVGVR